MNSDPHAPYVAELSASGNWAGLVRYGIAHGLHQPAIDAAIAVLHGRHFGVEHAALRTWLTEFRDSPLHPREAFEPGALPLDEEQQASLFLAATVPAVALCEIAGQFPPARQTELFQMGQEMVRLWQQLAVQFEDFALQAVSYGFLARSHQELFELEDAVASYDEALAKYRKLAESRPDVYLPAVATTLNNLGNV